MNTHFWIGSSQTSLVSMNRYIVTCLLLASSLACKPQSKPPLSGKWKIRHTHPIDDSMGLHMNNYFEFNNGNLVVSSVSTYRATYTIKGDTIFSNFEHRQAPDTLIFKVVGSDTVIIKGRQGWEDFYLLREK